MFRSTLVTFLLLVTTGSLTAQFFVAEKTVPRRLTRVAWRGQTGEQKVAIEYGQPKWRPEYDKFMASRSAQYVPLGTDALTTLRSDVDLALGDTKVPRGGWYLRVHRDKEQRWSLTLTDVGKAGATEFVTKPDLEVPIQVEHDAEPIDLLDITLTVPDRRKPNLSLAIGWGAHRVRLGVTPRFDLRIAKGTPEFAPKSSEPVVTTASGLQHQKLKAGSGAFVSPTDTVRVHYTSWLSDGSLFDTSYLHGEAVTLPVNSLLQGFAEGLQLMQPGATYRLTLPPELAYGERGAGEAVPPNATLVFVVTLLGIEN